MKVNGSTWLFEWLYCNLLLGLYVQHLITWESNDLCKFIEHKAWVAPSSIDKNLLLEKHKWSSGYLIKDTLLGDGERKRGEKRPSTQGRFEPATSWLPGVSSTPAQRQLSFDCLRCLRAWEGVFLPDKLEERRSGRGSCTARSDASDASVPASRCWKDDTFWG